MSRGDTMAAEAASVLSLTLHGRYFILNEKNHQN